MSKQVVNIGAVANDGTGDPLRTAMDKLNDNFNEIYAALGGNTVTNLVNGSQQIDVPNRANKVAFLYATYADLPSATTYNGSLAVVTATGSLYYAHGGNWNKLLTDSSNNAITNYYEVLSDVAYSGNLLDLNGGITDGDPGEVLTTDGAGNFSFTTISGGGGGGNSFTNIAIAGQNTIVADSSTDTLTLVAGSNITLTTNSTSDSITISSIGGGGSSAIRQSQTANTASIANNASATLSFDGLGISYVLYSIEVDRACWVRIYTDTASLSADSGRSQGSDPAEGSGLIAEVIATDATTFKVSPGVFGYVEDGETEVAVAITNLSGSTAVVSVTLNVLTLES